jgi:UDP-N-acetylmuramoyl-tripeptide--D-alanyl-D-alanine ligase
MVIGVGKNAAEIVRAAEKDGRVTARFFETSEEAAEFAVKKIRSGDLVLVKGSRGVRMETIITNCELPTAN